MFLQACVCPQGGGVSASVHAGIPPWARHPPQTRHPPDQTPTPGPDTTPPGPDTPLESRLQHTVNERPVRILLECILVKSVQ